MAATIHLTLEHGRLVVPDHVQREWNLHDGDQLQVSLIRNIRPFILQELRKDPAEIDWSVFEGILADEGVDLNAELEQDRIRENEPEARH